MRRDHLTAVVLLIAVLTAVSCSSNNEATFRPNNARGGASAGTPPSQGAGTGGTGGLAQAGASSGGGSSAGNAPGGSAAGGEGTLGGAGAGGIDGDGGDGSGGTGPRPYEPCAGKACGDVCTLCDPRDAACVEGGVTLTCSGPSGTCSMGRPACTVPQCDGDKQYYRPGCSSTARAAPIVAAPFAPGCYDACTSAAPCSEGFSCVSVWSDPSAQCAPQAPCLGVCGATAQICLAN